MRSAARLLMQLNKNSGNGPQAFSVFIAPEKWDDVLKAVNDLCGGTMGTDGRMAFKTPSLASRLGHILVKIGKWI